MKKLDLKVNTFTRIHISSYIIHLDFYPAVFMCGVDSGIIVEDKSGLTIA